MSLSAPKKTETDEGKMQLKQLMLTYINTLESLEMFDNDGL